MPKNFAAALISAVFLVGIAAGTLSVISAANITEQRSNDLTTGTVDLARVL